MQCSAKYSLILDNKYYGISTKLQKDVIYVYSNLRGKCETPDS